MPKLAQQKRTHMPIHMRMTQQLSANSLTWNHNNVQEDSDEDYSSVPEDSSDYSSEELSDSGLDSDEAEVRSGVSMCVFVLGLGRG